MNNLQPIIKQTPKLIAIPIKIIIYALVNMDGFVIYLHIVGCRLGVGCSMLHKRSFVYFGLIYSTCLLLFMYKVG